MSSGTTRRSQTARSASSTGGCSANWTSAWTRPSFRITTQNKTALRASSPTSFSGARKMTPTPSSSLTRRGWSKSTGSARLTATAASLRTPKESCGRSSTKPSRLGCGSSCSQRTVMFARRATTNASGRTAWPQFSMTPSAFELFQHQQKGPKMYKVMGADGKEYGPISLEQFSQWAAEGRVSPQTRVQPVGATDWTAAAGIPELQSIFARLGRAPTVVLTSPISPPASGEPQKGLAVTSLVLGILSLVCLGPLTGIPAIICGHIARRRSRQSPAQYSGPGMALAGMVLGYASLALAVVVSAILSWVFLPALSQANGKAEEIRCANNMKMIGLSFRTWAIDHSDQ